MENNTPQTMGVPALKIMDAVNAGYGFVLKPSADLLKTFLTMTVVNLLLTYVGSLGTGMSMLTTLLTGLAALPLAIFLNQKVVTGQASGNYLGYFVEPVLWKVLLMLILISVAVFIVSFAASFLIFFTTGFNPLMPVVLVVVGILLVLYCAVRLGFLIPHIVVHNKMEMGAPLHLTKGMNALRVLGVIFLAGLPAVGAAVLMWFFGLYELSHVMGGMSHTMTQLPTADIPLTDTVEGTQAGIQAGSSILLTLGKGLASAVISYLGLIASAALAHGYKTLTQKI
jgi:hypothetical protein